MNRWKTLPLAEACEKITDGTHHSPPIQSVGIPYVTAKHIKADGIDFFSDPWFISENDHRAIFSRCDPRPGDVLYIKDGATTGIAAVNRYAFEFSMLSSVALLRPRSAVLTPEFLCHWLNAPLVKDRILGGMAGVAIRRLTLEKINAIRIPLPPVPEQRRIAAILDKADELRAKRRAALAKLDSLTQSIFLDMFGDPTKNDKSWPTARVSDLCNLVRGSSPRPQGDPRFFGGPVPRLMVADITRDGWLVTPMIDSLTIEGARRSRPVTAGTVVMAVSGKIGLVAQLAIDACVHDGFVAFTELDHEKCEPWFLLALLHFSKARHEKHKAGAIFINLTTTDIKAMCLPIPPRRLQSEFAVRLRRVNELKDRERISLAALDVLFASSQQSAFQGEL